MKKSKLLLIVMLCLVSLLFITCSFSKKGVEKVGKDAVTQIRYNGKKFYSFNTTKFITSGNHSYIPINLDGEPTDYIEGILGALTVFEENFESKIIKWKIEKRGNKTLGIWIDH